VARGRGVGLSDRCGIGSWASRSGGRRCSLACSPCSLFDPRRRRGRILRDVPRPDANRGARSAARSHLLFRGRCLRAERSGAPRLGGVDRMSRGSCYSSVEKLCLATWDGSPKGGDAGRCFRISMRWRLRSRQPGRWRVSRKIVGRRA
jgi:hypothetical protein